jgi:hypothetical protein
MERRRPAGSSRTRRALGTRIRTDALQQGARACLWRARGCHAAPRVRPNGRRRSPRGGPRRSRLAQRMAVATCWMGRRTHRPVGRGFAPQFSRRLPATSPALPESKTRPKNSRQRLGSRAATASGVGAPGPWGLRIRHIGGATSRPIWSAGVPPAVRRRLGGATSIRAQRSDAGPATAAPRLSAERPAAPGCDHCARPGRPRTAAKMAALHFSMSTTRRSGERRR